MVEVRTYNELNAADYHVLSTIEIPQANDLQKVFEVGLLVREGIIEVNEIAARLDVVAREGAYYADAACAVRVIRKRESYSGEYYDLTGWVDDYLAADQVGRERLMVFLTIDSPHLKYVAASLGESLPLSAPLPPSLRDVGLVTPVLQELGDLSVSTARRRASCLAAWTTQVDRMARSFT